MRSLILIPAKALAWLISLSAFSSANSQQLILPVGHTEDIFGTSFLRSGQFVITSAYDNNSKLWDVYSGRILQTFPKLAHSNTHIINSGVTTLLSPDKKHLVAFTVDGWLRSWKVPEGNLVFQKRIENIFGTRIQFSDDGKLLLVNYGYSRNDVDGEVLNALTGRSVLKITKEKGLPFSQKRSIKFSPKGNLYLIREEEKLTAYSVNRKQRINEVVFNEQINDFGFAPDGMHILITLKNSRERLICDSALQVVSKLPDNGWLKFRPDGKHCIYTGSGKIQLADFLSGTVSKEYKVNTERDLAAEFSSDGNFIFLVSADPNAKLAGESYSVVHIWETADAESGIRLNAESGNIRSVEFSPDGKYAVTISDNSELWDLSSGKRIEKHAGRNASFSIDSRLLSITNNNVVKVFNSKTGALLSVLAGKANTVTQAVFSPDKQHFATLTNENVLRIWDKGLAKITQTFSSGETFKQVQYSPDGQKIVALTGNNNAIVFSLDNKPERILINVQYAKFTSGGDRLLLVRNNSIALYDLANNLEQHIHKEDWPIAFADISADEKGIVYVYGGSGMGLIDISAKTVTRKVLEDENILSVEFDNTSSLVFLLGDHGTSELVDAKTAKTIKALGKRVNVEAGVSSIGGYSMRNFWKGQEKAFSEDGKWLIYSPYLRYHIDIVDLKNDFRLTKIELPGTSLIRGFKGGAADIFLTEGLDDTVRIWKKLNSGFRQISKYPANNLSLSADANSLLLVNNVELGYFDLQKSKLLFKSIGLGPEDYFSQAAGKNYYTATKSGAAALTYKINGHYFSFDQFDHELNRPDKVLEAIGGDTALIRSYRQAFLKRLSRLKLNPAKTTTVSRPSLSILNEKDLDIFQEGNEVRVRVKSSDKVPLDRLNVWVNEVPVYGRLGIQLKKQKRLTLDTALTIQLSAGKNLLEISVTNIEGTESYRMPYYFSRPEQKGKIYFVGIGIDSFQQSRHNLNWSVKDIRDLALFLKEKHHADIEIDTLFNRSVSFAKISALKKTLLSSSVNDMVIIAYSGHGLLSTSFDYYLSTYNVNFDTPEVNGLAYEVLEGLLDSIPARQKLMMIDACHSGEVDKEEMLKHSKVAEILEKNGIRSSRKPVPKDGILGMKNSFELMQELFVNVGRSTGATIISAAAGTQFAYEKGDLKNGVFTFSILEFMKSYPTATVSDLRLYLNKRVSELTGGLQVPTTRSETKSVDWKVW